MEKEMNFLRRKLFSGLLAIAILILFLLPAQTDQLVILNSNEQKPINLYSVEAHMEKIVSFIEMIVLERTFGLTDYQVPVAEELWHYFSRSLWIIFPAYFISILLGVSKGIVDFSLTGRRWSVLGSGTTWLGQSLPDFFFVITIQYGLLITIRMGFPYIDLFGYDHWYNIFFPIIFLSMYPLFYVARITSSALAAEAEKDYVRTARAMGATKQDVLIRHMLKNAMYTVLTHFYTVMVIVIAGLPIVEFLTFYRGAGRRLMEAFGINPGRAPGPQSTTAGFEEPMAISLVLVFLLFLFVALWITNIVKAMTIPTYQMNIRVVFTSFCLFGVVALVFILIILQPIDIKYIPVHLGT
jgi:oligopeptide transport system permease protein